MTHRTRRNGVRTIRIIMESFYVIKLNVQYDTFRCCFFSVLLLFFVFFFLFPSHIPFFVLKWNFRRKSSHQRFSVDICNREKKTVGKENHGKFVLFLELKKFLTNYYRRWHFNLYRFSIIYLTITAFSDWSWYVTNSWKTVILYCSISIRPQVDQVFRLQLPNHPISINDFAQIIAEVEIHRYKW